MTTSGVAPDAPGPASLATRLRFGPFELDLRTGELLEGGRLVPLAPLPSKVLAVLASRPGEMVTRLELRQRLWPNANDRSGTRLSTCMRQIRQALRESASAPRYIQLVRRCGYRFNAVVTSVEGLTFGGVKERASPPDGRRAAAIAWPWRPAIVVMVLAAGLIAVATGVALTTGRGAAQPVAVAASASPERQRFVDWAAYLLSQGGQWVSTNPDGEPRSARFRAHYLYQYVEGGSSGVLRFSMTGAEAEREIPSWEGYYFWHPVRDVVSYQALGTGGAVAQGQAHNDPGTLVYELVLPDGRVELHKDETVSLSQDEMRSTSFKYVGGVWQPIRSLTWRRVPQDRR